jgi:acyl-CoA thioesterase II
MSDLTAATSGEPDPVDRFLALLDLEVTGEDRFRAVTPAEGPPRLFGGQVAAQSLRAATLTVPADRLPHSLHAYFIRPGDHTEPIRFEVDRIRNGRSFVTRRVVARQSIGAIFNLAASFHVVEDEADVQAVSLDAAAGSPDDHLSDGWSHVFDRRPVGDMRRSDAGLSRAWLRMEEPVEDDPLLRACALSYVSDDLPTDGAIALHPDRTLVRDEGDWERTFMNASLDHAIWFHRAIDPAEWHLHELRGHNLTGARGLAIGEIFGQDGTHAATVVQEVLLRRVRPR